MPEILYFRFPLFASIVKGLLTVSIPNCGSTQVTSGMFSVVSAIAYSAQGFCIFCCLGLVTLPVSQWQSAAMGPYILQPSSSLPLTLRSILLSGSLMVNIVRGKVHDSPV